MRLLPLAVIRCWCCPHPCAVENDDVASAFSLQDLLFLHDLCGVPLVFDFHHHKVGCSGKHCLHLLHARLLPPACLRNALLR